MKYNIEQQKLFPTGGEMLKLSPISFSDAREYVFKNHRHNKSIIGHKFSISAVNESGIVGVIIVGRPISRILDNGLTLEVTRCCPDGTKNVNSFLYAAAWRVTRNLGYDKLITYISKNESGKSLIAAGYRLVGKTSGRSWSCKSRPRTDKHIIQDRLRFEIGDKFNYNPGVK